MLLHRAISHNWHLGPLLCLATALACANPSASAGGLRDISVKVEGKRYFLHADSWVRLSSQEVKRALADFVNLPRLNGSLKHVKILERLANGGTRMEAQSEFCLLAVCQQFTWVQDVIFMSNGDMAMTIVPNRGDFRAGKGRWRMHEDSGGTRLTFDIELTPNFWLPSVFGPWLMKRQLSADTIATIEGLEKLAGHRGKALGDTP